MLLSSCGPSCAYEDTIYTCGQLVQILPYNLMNDPQCQWANHWGCTSRRICKNGKWVGVETGPWWRCDCGNDSSLPKMTTTTQLEIDTTKVCDFYDSTRCWSK